MTVDNQNNRAFTFDSHSKADLLILTLNIGQNFDERHTDKKTPDQCSLISRKKRPRVIGEDTSTENTPRIRAMAAATIPNLHN